MKYSNYKFIFIALLMLTSTINGYGQKKRPNIIFILADDLGYGNLTSFNSNSKIPTPHIDLLGKEGTKYTQFYAANAVCAPSRCGLMTGKDMGHSYIRGNTRLPIRPTDTTLAQLFQAAGYKTGMFGKWGLGEAGTTGSPEIKGFDEFFGYLHQGHAHDYYTNYLFEVHNGVMRKVATDTTQYSDDLIINKAYQFIRDNKDKPFFLYVPLTLPHAELDPPAKYMKLFQNADGSSKFPPETPFKRDGGEYPYRSQAQPHVAFAAMITKLDEDVGNIEQLVKQLGLDDNTYIFFTSDNGPHKEGGGDPDYFNSSGPLRGIKRDLYEGGIREPLLVRAPGKVAAGRVSDQQWAFWDIMPTFTDLVGIKHPKNIDGLSFVNSLHNKKQTLQHNFLYWQFNEGYLQEAVRQGDWKLIRFKRKGQPQVYELYNLKNDIGEKTNLAAQNPGKVKTLAQLMKQAKSPAENKEFDWSDMEK